MQRDEVVVAIWKTQLKVVIGRAATAIAQTFSMFGVRQILTKSVNSWRSYDPEFENVLIMLLQ